MPHAGSSRMTTPGPTGGPKGKELNHLVYMATFRFHKPSWATIEFTATSYPLPKRPAVDSRQPCEVGGVKSGDFWGARL